MLAMWVEDGDSDISSQMTDAFYMNCIGIDWSLYLLKNKQHRNSTGKKVLSPLWSYSFHPPLDKNATEYTFCLCGLPKGPHTKESCTACTIFQIRLDALLYISPHIEIPSNSEASESLKNINNNNKNSNKQNSNQQHHLWSFGMTTEKLTILLVKSILKQLGKKKKSGKDEQYEYNE